jgi:hypothetical protein
VAGSRLPRWGSIAGAAVGTLVAVGLVLAGPLRLPDRRDLSDAGDAFLAAWERSRTATLLVQGEFRRRQANGATLSSPTELVQRPPDRLVRQFGGVSGTVEGHPVVCATDPDGRYRCFPGTETSPPYQETVRSELATLRSYFEPPTPGTRPLYRVIRGTERGCFELYQQIPYADAPYGVFARFCFDEATGALRDFERHLENGTVESEGALTIETRVIDGDFDISANEGYEPEVEGNAATPPPASTPSEPTPTNPPAEQTVPGG